MEQTTSCVLFIAFVLLVFPSYGIADPLTYSTYNILNYGAKPDGDSDSTQAMVAAWALACGSTKAATIYVPPGRFLLRNVVFRGLCKNNAIVFRIDGTLVAPSDYKVLGTGNWLLFEHVNGVSVYGGILDGQGTGLWACKRSGKGCPRGATHAIMTDVENPIVIDQHYCPDEKNCPGLVSGVKISDVTYRDIHGTSATEVAVKFDCSPRYPCTNIKLEDVKLTYRNQPAEASCSNADGTASGFIQPSSCL
ncbi:hypothetical protein V6N12_017355 [Hibiscus sabdariffa]|uniref:Rhamnogalacturonase A/B/Epimerase-like pectate lyase domain-containing protein n=1 Tax=Hibiscus sabdariffa TaxID=183260 RepID=A0ABR2CF94_9ROSI